MAWEWSHSTEAYVNLQDRINNQKREWLEVVWAEWAAYSSREDHIGGFNQKKYEKALKQAKKLASDTLADAIFEKASELATCTNGGWEAWCCPFGCGCHMLPFSPEKTEEKEDFDEWVKEFEDEEL